MRFRRNRKEGASDSQNALNEATQQLEKIKSRDPEIREVSRTSRRIRVENHFAEKLRILLEGANRKEGSNASRY